VIADSRPPLWSRRNGWRFWWTTGDWVSRTGASDHLSHAWLWLSADT